MGMQLISTRDGALASPFEAVLRGLAPDGGLYVPARMPVFDEKDLREFLSLTYPALSARIIGSFFDEIPQKDMLSLAQTAYASFDTPDVAPLVPIDQNTVALELFHGPTLAFKDVALQMLPLLLAYSAKQTVTAKKVLILVATSGDTGKAALCGFADKQDTAIVVFYPEDGVSAAQKLQMQTQDGDNVGVFAVSGNFDDCQRGVKALMGDGDFLAALDQNGYNLSSANSINFGRLVPQIAYYFSAYAALCRTKEIECGEAINFAVPTGNFGNILAGWMAKRMGLPVRKLVGASNRNNVLDEFYHTGVYKAGLTLHATSSPSMDILVSSNLERLLFSLSNNDGARVLGWMKSQRENKNFDVGKDVLARLHDEFLWGWADDAAVADTIRETHENDGVLLDPHAAVGMRILRDKQQTGELKGKTVLLCTASPYKFASDVLRALGGQSKDAKADVAALSRMTHTTPPQAITALFDAPIRHDVSLRQEDMKQAVLQSINAR